MILSYTRQQDNKTGRKYLRNSQHQLITETIQIQ
jgi:hypothetical protein